MNVNLNEAMTSLCESKFEMFIVLNTKYQIVYATTIFPPNKWFWCETIFFLNTTLVNANIYKVGAGRLYQRAIR